MRLLIAGGGTGGHLFPGVAIAEELRAREPDAPVRFVGTRRGIEARVLPATGWDVAFIEVSGLKTVGALGAVKGVFRLPRALWQARRALREFEPDVVIGVGGYASGPVVLMARLRGIPTAICEQNSIPGLTNKMLGKMARAVFLSFEMSGNPVRKPMLRALLEAAPARAREPLSVLVCGGSLGAVAVNEIASKALIDLARERPLRIVHQTGDKGFDETVARYQAGGIDADVRPFIQEMATAYLDADVIVSRAGATTVAELAIAGKPAILVPYPFAADNHQELNAQEMRDAGAALTYKQADLTPAILADELRKLLDDDDRRARMGSAMKALAKPGAAATIVDWCQAQASAKAKKKAR